MLDETISKAIEFVAGIVLLRRSRLYWEGLGFHTDLVQSSLLGEDCDVSIVCAA